jgi:hypothetical protein
VRVVAVESTAELPPLRPALVPVMNSGLPETPVTLSVPRSRLSLPPPLPSRVVLPDTGLLVNVAAGAVPDGVPPLPEAVLPVSVLPVRSPRRG